MELATKKPLYFVKSLTSKYARVGSAIFRDLYSEAYKPPLFAKNVSHDYDEINDRVHAPPHILKRLAALKRATN
jgi:hypothetical protein